jgi:AhpD family alkylhydroperoxidase
MKTAQDAYQDMQNTLGLVPAFLRNYPAGGIVGAWKELKSIEFNPATALLPKFKHLIGLAVSAQIPCDYCTYYKTQAAIFENATKEELQESVAMAGITRQWSTVLNGQYTNEKQFQAEVDRMMKFLKAKSAKEVTQNI